VGAGWGGEEGVLGGLGAELGSIDGVERIVLVRESLTALLSVLAAEPPPADRPEESEALRILAASYGRRALGDMLRRLIERRELARGWAERTARLAADQLVARWRAATPGPPPAPQRLRGAP